MDVFIQTAVSGLAFGGIYALVALGYDIIWSVSRVLNFAQGELMMVAAMLVLQSNLNWGWPIWLAMFFGIGMAITATNVMHEIAIRPFAGSAHSVNWVLGVLAVATILSSGASVIWGSDLLVFPTLLSDVYVRVYGATIDAQQIAVIVGCLLIMVTVELFYLATKRGKASRALAYDQNVAASIGIPVRSIVRLNYAIAGVVAGISGILISPLVNVTAFMGFEIGLKGLVAAIIGGLGYARGGLVGGLLVGVTEAFVAVYWTPLLSEPIVFLLLIAILLVLPRGLFGGRRIVERV